jgi:hypothetical protein
MQEMLSKPEAATGLSSNQTSPTSALVRMTQ